MTTAVRTRTRAAGLAAAIAMAALLVLTACSSDDSDSNADAGDAARASGSASESDPGSPSPADGASEPPAASEGVATADEVATEAGVAGLTLLPDAELEAAAQDGVILQSGGFGTLGAQTVLILAFPTQGDLDSGIELLRAELAPGEVGTMLKGQHWLMAAETQTEVPLDEATVRAALQPAADATGGEFVSLTQG